jgi:hypothetical protein
LTGPPPFGQKALAVEDTGLNKDASSRPTYDASEWPIFIVTLPRAPMSASEFQEHLDRCGEPYERGEPFCMLITGDHPPFSAVQRKAVADAMKKHDRRHPGLMMGCAIVNRSVLVRGIITAVTWLAPPPYPLDVFADLPKAKAWLRRLLLTARAKTGRVWD